MVTYVDHCNLNLWHFDPSMNITSPRGFLGLVCYTVLLLLCVWSCVCLFNYHTKSNYDYFFILSIHHHPKNSCYNYCLYCYLPMETTQYNNKNKLSFDRNNSTRFRTLEGLLDTFAEEGYERESVERWIDDGRIRWISSDDDIDSDSTGERNGNSGGGGYFHSEVNPAFRLLCYETFCDIPNGCEDVWASIATATTNKNNTMKKETTSFPCHLMVAGERKKNSKNPYHGTICDENSVEWMRKIMNGDDDYDNDKDREKPVQTYGGSCSDNSGRGGRLTIRRYPAAGHSIHNSDRRRFMCDLRNIYTEALAS